MCLNLIELQRYFLENQAMYMKSDDLIFKLTFLLSVSYFSSGKPLYPKESTLPFFVKWGTTISPSLQMVWLVQDNRDESTLYFKYMPRSENSNMEIRMRAGSYSDVSVLNNITFSCIYTLEMNMWIWKYTPIQLFVNGYLQTRARVSGIPCVLKSLIHVTRSYS